MWVIHSIPVLHADIESSYIDVAYLDSYYEKKLTFNLKNRLHLLCLIAPAKLSTKCSMWVIVITQCLSCIQIHSYKSWRLICRRNIFRFWIIFWTIADMQFKQAFIFALFTSFCSTENKVVSVFVITQIDNVCHAYIFIHTDIEGSYIDVAYLGLYYERYLICNL